MSHLAIVLAIVAEVVGIGVTARAEEPPSRPVIPIVAPPESSSPAPSVTAPVLPLVTTVHRRRTAPLVGGAVLFGLSWGGAVFLSAALLNCRCTSGGQALWFAFPVLGPMLAGPKADGNIWYLWSAAQLGGAILLGYGIKGEDVPVTGEVRATHAAEAGHPEWQLAPMLAHDAHGMALTARW